MYVSLYICMFIYKITSSGSEEPSSKPVLVFIIIAVEKMLRNVSCHLLWQWTALPTLLNEHFAIQFACKPCTALPVLLAQEYTLPFPWRIACKDYATMGYFSVVTQLKTHKEILKFTYRL